MLRGVFPWVKDAIQRKLIESSYNFKDSPLYLEFWYQNKTGNNK